MKYLLIFTAILTLNVTSAMATPCPPLCPTCAPTIIACSVGNCGCESNAETGELGETVNTPIGPIVLPGEGTIGGTQYEVIMHEEWLIKNVWEAHILPSMMLMAQNMTTITMQQAKIVGTFFDAKHQLESQRLLQNLQAQAHKEYHPSTGMCRFGTNTRSLATADQKTNLNQIGLAARSTHRILMNKNAIGTGSARDDSRSRFKQFKERYCNPKDFGNALDLICKNQNSFRKNKDVNYTHSINSEDTLLVDFSDDVLTQEEEDILALSANLYGNRLLPSIPELHMANISGLLVIEGAAAYMETRALAAKRSIAFNSFAAQAAMRSEGAPSVVPYMTQILEEMGVEKLQIDRMLRGAPSYNTQMEILTKKLYQSPNFYSDLYDKPINIDRKDTSMQAIALMQKRDMYASQLRSEANTAIWLETLVEDAQNYHGNEARKVKNNTNILTKLGL